MGGYVQKMKVVVVVHLKRLNYIVHVLPRSQPTILISSLPSSHHRWQE